MEVYNTICEIEWSSFAEKVESESDEASKSNC